MNGKKSECKKIPLPPIPRRGTPSMRDIMSLWDKQSAYGRENRPFPPFGTVVLIESVGKRKEKKK